MPRGCGAVADAQVTDGADGQLCRPEPERKVGSQPMRVSRLSLMPPEKAPALALGIVIAVSLIVSETLAVIQLKRISPENSCGIFFLLGIVVVSTVWGVGLAVATSV